MPDGNTQTGATNPLPPGWNATDTSDALAEWTHAGHEMLVSVHKHSRSEYLILVEQYITANGWTSRITTQGAAFTDRDTAEQRARDVMTEASDGQHVVDALCAITHDDGDVIDFIAVYRDDIPGSITHDELETLVRAHLGDGDPDELTQTSADLVGDDDPVTIDVFPRPITHVEPADDVELGDHTTVSGQPEALEGEQ